MRALRWFLVVPAGIAGWYAAPWSEAVFYLALALGAAVAGAAIVALPAVVAPNWRMRVATIAFAAGVAFATYALATTGVWLAYVAAVASGGISLWVLKSRLERTPREQAAG